MPLLTTKQLAERWAMSPDTLDNWRMLGRGPRYLKLTKGGAVRYRLKEIVEWERRHLVSVRRRK